ncbi:hypothetical protein [Streptomyces sp. NPDC056844]|uniref:hypothetical protein n=1 Tax=unclassified Streptomyces TaxID=2593676 RepID=UPI00367D951B
MRTRTENAARVVVTGAGTAGARLAATAPGGTVIGEETHAPGTAGCTYRTAVVRGDRPMGGVLFGDLAAVSTLARTRQDDGALPAGTSLLHLLTNDGGF